MRGVRGGMTGGLDVGTALKVVSLCALADGGCSTCADGLIESAVKTWPDTDWYAVAGSMGDKSTQLRVQLNFPNQIPALVSSIIHLGTHCIVLVIWRRVS